MGTQRTKNVTVKKKKKSKAIFQKVRRYIVGYVVVRTRTKEYIVPKPYVWCVPSHVSQVKRGMLVLAKVNKGKAPVIISSVFDTDQITEYRKPVLCIFNEPEKEAHMIRLSELEKANDGYDPLIQSL